MGESNGKSRAPRNRTVTLSVDEVTHYTRNLTRLTGPSALHDIENKTINQDLFEILEWLPTAYVDLLFIDPPL